MSEGSEHVDQPSSEREPEPQTASVDEALTDVTGDASPYQSAGALTNEQALSITSASRTTVVVLAGGVGSGKTTLLTAIYEHFLQEPVNDYLFAGSETLFGYERLCHFGRYASGLEEAWTKTTHKLEPPWLHLRVRDRGLSKPGTDLLFANLSGEWFEQLATGKSNFEDFPHVFRADHFLLVLDGEKLAQGRLRDSERALVELLARRLIERDALASPDCMSVVVTKWDALVSAGTEAQEYADMAVERIAQVAARHGLLPHWRVAARPKSPEFPLGHGVPALFESWLSRPASFRRHPFDLSPISAHPFRTFQSIRPWPARR